jgi:oligoribonuclease NrnB/cAMP/cGMP phosphodiesterase (DHH superfamily)
VDPVLVIYHGTCQDGLAAAWVVREYYKKKVVGNRPCYFHAGRYGEDPPDVTGKDVIMVDITYKRQVMIGMAEKAKSIMVIDHHKSAKGDLVNMPPNVITYFDMDESGASLAWKILFPGEDLPRLIQHIKDRDLWLFKMEYTKELSAVLFSYPYDLDELGYMISKAEENGYALTEMIREGTAIVRRATADINALLPVVTRRMRIGNHDVPVANLPLVFTSEAGNIMSQGEPFAACYWDTPYGRVFSLRSSEGGEDVSVIAEKFGGGGHRNASGFTVPFADLEKKRML